MELVIDIDDEQVLFDIKNRGLEAETETDKVIINALYNGTPLPKGHGDLIDRGELEADAEWNCWYDDFTAYSLEQIANALIIIPADKEGEEVWEQK